MCWFLKWLLWTTNQQGGKGRGPGSNASLHLLFWKQRTCPVLVYPLMLQLTHQKIWNSSHEKQEESQKRRLKGLDRNLVWSSPFKNKEAAPKEWKWLLQCYTASHQAELELNPRSTGTQPRALSWYHNKPNGMGIELAARKPLLQWLKSEIYLLNVTWSRCQGLLWAPGNALRDPHSSHFLLCHPWRGPWSPTTWVQILPLSLNYGTSYNTSSFYTSVFILFSPWPQKLMNGKDMR